VPDGVFGRDNQDQRGWFGYAMKMGWWLFRIGLIVSVYRWSQGVPFGIYEWLFLAGFLIEISIEAHAHLWGFKRWRRE
jgi:hypothetical protein